MNDIQTKVAGGRSWTWFAPLVCLLLGGCMTVGPDYTQPAVSTPTNWSVPTDGAVQTGPLDPLALGQWWIAFDDPILSDLMLGAQHNNLDLRQAEARLRQARAQRRLTGAERLPIASVGASARRSSGSEKMGSGSRATTTSYANTLDASWELDLFGGKRRAAESSEATLQASREALRDVMVSLLAEVALNYVQCRSAQVRLSIVESNLVAQTETYQIAVWRQQANLVTQLDVDQARMSLEQTRAELPTLRTSIQQSEHQLAILLGVAPGRLLKQLNAGAARIPTYSSRLVVGVPADALRQRPDVREAERKLAAQTAQIGVATAARYPDLTLSGSIGIEALSFGDLYTAGARTAQGLLNAGFTLFDGGQIRQKIAIQTALQEEALAAYEATVLRALKDVEDALVAFANECARQTALHDTVAAGESAFNLARDQYTAGLVDFQTVLSTQQSLLSAQSALASSRAEVTSNVIRLYKSLGGGWTPSLGSDDTPSKAPGRTGAIE
jgi:NodT family efflux transporter outer membrane factor (OMF) lipoprotein